MKAITIVFVVMLAIISRADSKIFAGQSFRITYPDDWLIKSNKNTTLILIAPTKLGGRFRENVAIIKHPAGDIDKYLAKGISNLSTGLMGFQLLTKGEVLRNGKKFTRVSYRYSYGLYKLTGILYYVTVRNDTYELTCTMADADAHYAEGICSNIVYSII